MTATVHDVRSRSTARRTTSTCRPAGCSPTRCATTCGYRHPRRLRARRLRRLHRAVDGDPVRSCLLFAVSLDGARVTTTEGCRSADGGMGPVQQAFHECHALQCGFCTPGFVTTVTAYLREHPDPPARGGPRGDQREPLPLHRLLRTSSPPCSGPPS